MDLFWLSLCWIVLPLYCLKKIPSDSGQNLWCFWCSSLEHHRGELCDRNLMKLWWRWRHCCCSPQFPVHSSNLTPAPSSDWRRVACWYSWLSGWHTATRAPRFNPWQDPVPEVFELWILRINWLINMHCLIRIVLYSSLHYNIQQYTCLYLMLRML